MTTSTKTKAFAKLFESMINGNPPSMGQPLLAPLKCSQQTLSFNSTKSLQSMQRKHNSTQLKTDYFHSAKCHTVITVTLDWHSYSLPLENTQLIQNTMLIHIWFCVQHPLSQCFQVLSNYLALSSKWLLLKALVCPCILAYCNSINHWFGLNVTGESLRVSEDTQNFIL